MKQFGIITSLIVLLAGTAGAMGIKGPLATCLGLATADSSHITNPGNGCVRVVHTPSLLSGFSSLVHIYLQGDEAEARTTASQLMGFGVGNLTARIYTGQALKPGDLKVKIETERVNGTEGMSNSDSSSDRSSYNSSSRRGSYSSSYSSGGGSSSGMDAASVYIHSSISFERMTLDGQYDIIPTLNIPVGGSDTAMTNQRSSQSNSFNRDNYSSTSRRHGYSGGSSYSGSSASSSSSYRSPEIGRAMMADRIADKTEGNLAALIMDAITNAALSGQIPGAIFDTYQSPQTTTPAQNNGQNISAPLQ